MTRQDRFASVLAAALTCAAGVALAEPSSLVAWDAQTVKLLQSADAQAGSENADENGCARCHGEQGVSDRPGTPHIAGLGKEYLYKQLRDYRDGTRDNRRMARYVEDLSDQQLADLSAWYSGLAGPTLQPTPAAAGTAQELVSRGDAGRLIPACGACHGSAGEGSRIGVPALAGQELDYLIETMTAYQEEERANDVYSVMRYISSELSEAEIEALAAYYSGLAAYPEAEQAQ
jgi:cytochrome c553